MEDIEAIADLVEGYGDASDAETIRNMADETIISGRRISELEQQLLEANAHNESVVDCLFGLYHASKPYLAGQDVNFKDNLHLASKLIHETHKQSLLLHDADVIEGLIDEIKAEYFEVGNEFAIEAITLFGFFEFKAQQLRGVAKTKTKNRQGGE